MAMAELKAAVPWETFDAVEKMRKSRGVSRSKEVRDVVGMGLSYFEFARSRVRKFLGDYYQGSIATTTIALHLISEVQGIMSHIDSVIDHMVADGELKRVEDNRIVKTDKMPVTKQRVSARR